MGEETFIIIKPNAISQGLVGTIIKRFQQIGRIGWVSGRIKSREWCKQHYAHIFNNLELINVYHILEDFMTETLLIGFTLIGDDIIRKARKMAGATQIEKALPGTIRGDFGLKNYPTCYNLVHVSDGPEAVEREIRLFLDKDTDYNFGIITDE